MTVQGLEENQWVARMCRGDPLDRDCWIGLSREQNAQGFEEMEWDDLEGAVGDSRYRSWSRDEPNNLQHDGVGDPAVSRTEVIREVGHARRCTGVSAVVVALFLGSQTAQLAWDSFLETSVVRASCVSHIGSCVQFPHTQALMNIGLTPDTDKIFTRKLRF